MGPPSVIDIYDPETECVVASVTLDGSQTERVAADLDVKIADLERGTAFELDHSDLARIKSVHSLDFGVEATVGKWRMRLDIDDLPYQVHTNRELSLMLSGKKPLAVFSYSCGSEFTEGDAAERLFDAYVSSGRFVKRDMVEPLSPDGTTRVRTVLFAVPSEAWRIDAYILLMRAAQTSGWSEEFERRQGTLLGYSDWENGAYLELLRKRSKNVSSSD